MLVMDIEEARAEDGLLQDRHYENETVSRFDLSGIECKRVEFVKCRFQQCNFSKAGFYETAFISCDFANGSFERSYWKTSRILGCNGDGAVLKGALLRERHFLSSSLRYANCSGTVWEGCSIEDCVFQESLFSEAKLKRLKLNKVNFSSADFFKTPLKGIDLSDCMIDGILVSDTYHELKGVMVNALQAAELIKILGVKVV